MKIIIGPYSFNVSEPYSAGQQMTASEAQVLHQVRTERIRNRMAKRLPVDGLNPDSLAEFEIELARYDSEFTFNPVKRRDNRLGKLEIEIRVVAEEESEAQFRAKGRDPTEELSEFEDLVGELMAENQIKAEAQRRLDIKAKVIDTELEDLLA